MAVAVAIGAVSVIVGLLISFHNGSAAGATMALVAVVAFLAVLTLQAARRSLVRIGADEIAAIDASDLRSPP